MLKKPTRFEISPSTEAANGQQALEIVETGSFDLIISDVDMPRMNGIDMCKRLKERSKIKGLPVAMVSTFDSQGRYRKRFSSRSLGVSVKKFGN